MIRYQITGQSPVEMNTAAKLLLDHPRLDVDRDSGNRNGRKDGYIRYIEVRVKRRALDRPRKPKPKPRLDGADKISMARLCWDRLVHKTDTDEEAEAEIIKLIEHIERKLR